MNKIWKWVVKEFWDDGIHRYRPDIDGPKLVALKGVEYKLWNLATDIRRGRDIYKEIPLEKRLPMCNGVEQSIVIVQSLIKEIEDLPK